MDDKIYRDIVERSTAYIQKQMDKDGHDYEIKNAAFHKKLRICTIISIIFLALGIAACSINITNLDNYTTIRFSGILCILGSIGLMIFALNMKPQRADIDYDVLLYDEIKENIIYTFAGIFGTSEENVKYDINNLISRNKRQLGIEEQIICTRFYNNTTGRMNTKREKRNVEHFWLEKRKVDFIYDKFCEKYHKKSNERIKDDLSIEKAKLQNENLSLTNETIKIKINLTKPWTCQFCGNMNRGSDMECLKCGGIRPQ